jgi:hypothetical protein
MGRVELQRDHPPWPPPTRVGNGGGIHLDAVVHERPAAKPRLASGSSHSLSPATVRLEAGAEACKDSLPTMNNAADQESPFTPCSSTSPGRIRLRLFSTENNTTTVPEGSNHLPSFWLCLFFYSCSVVDAKVLLLLYGNPLLVSLGSDWSGL